MFETTVSEVCSFVRSRKHTKKAMEIAAQIFGLSGREVRAILIAHDVIDQDDNLIKNLRLTGLEPKKEEKEVKNPGTFVWSERRKTKLKTFYQNGMEPYAIAHTLGCTETQVYDAITRFDIVKTSKVEPMPKKTDPKPEAAPAPAKPKEQVPETPSVAQEPDSSATEFTSEPENDRIGEALNLLDEFVTLYENDRIQRGFLTLGKLHALLSDMAGRPKES